MPPLWQRGAKGDFTKKPAEKDRVRDEALKGIGLRVVRFSDRGVFGNTEAVIEKIWSYL